MIDILLLKDREPEIRPFDGIVWVGGFDLAEGKDRGFKVKGRIVDGVLIQYSVEEVTS